MKNFKTAAKGKLNFAGSNAAPFGAQNSAKRVENLAQLGDCEVFTINVNNNIDGTPEDRVIKLLPGLAWAPGQSVDGLITDGAGNSDVDGDGSMTVAGSPQPISYLHAMINKQKMILAAVKVSSDQVGQKAIGLKISDEDPFADRGSKTLTPENFSMPSDMNDKMVLFTVGKVVGFSTKLETTVLAGANTSYSFFFRKAQ